MTEKGKGTPGGPSQTSDELRKTITQRELECLDWTARGKTSWETSIILEISENTVNFHLKNALRKLDANNKCHAIAKAMARGIVRL